MSIEGPSWAERARTLVAQARIARLDTLCRGVAPTTTTVAIDDPGSGVPRVWLDASAPAVTGLAVRRVACLTVTSPDSVWSLRLVGSYRMDHPGPTGLRAYRPTLLSARIVGPRPVTVAIAAYLHAEPDPLRDSSPDLLHHLEQSHGDALLDWARSRGHDAIAVSATALDRYGVELSLLGERGVELVRVPWPGGEVTLDGPDVAGPLLGLPVDCACVSRSHPNG